MRIVAIGSKLSDFEVGCYRTLMKYSADGHAVNLVIAGNTTKWKEKDLALANEKCKKIGITKVYFTDKFDEHSVTQENVRTLHSIIKKVNPCLAILPFHKTSVKKREILANSAILACRGIKNILMYEITKNKNFSPNIFFTFEKKSPGKPMMMTSEINSSIRRKAAQKFSSNKIGTDKLTEAFESLRVLLLDSSEMV